ncbi:MAG: hypothetical protein KJ896_00015 [Nanoarchaeota archaeon]|nr:hypothetical protein [Nanoarchaeota archaeon]
MEYRKLIAFGKSSYVVSLPKPWINQNKLKKGDVIYFDEIDNNLILQSKQHNGEDSKVIVQVDGKSIKRIQRDIISAYVNNYKTIILQGKEIKDKATEIQNFVQRLVALEIVEQDSKKIIARDFLNLKDISIEQIIRKMDIIARSMLSDCKNTFSDDTYASIALRDNDINKFRFLVYRMVWYGLNNPSTFLKNFNVNSVDLFNYWNLSLDIEQIGDCVKRVSRHMNETKLSTKSKKIYVELLSDIEKNYLEIIKAYFKKDVEMAHNLVEKRGELIKRCDEFFMSNKEAPMIGYLVYNTKGLIVNTSAIARTIYQGMFSH